METKQCGVCGEFIPANAEFCSFCGSKQQNCDNYERYNNVNDRNHSQYCGEPKKKNKGAIIGIIVTVLLVLACIGMMAEKYAQQREEENNEKIRRESLENKTNAILNETESILDETSEIFTEIQEREKVKEYQKGILTSTSYESEFIGIRYTPSNDWALKTEDELEQISKEPNVTWEMQAISLTDGSNVVMGVEKLPTKNISESTYIEALKKTVENLTEISVSGFEEKGTKVFCGEEYYVIAYNVTTNGMDCKQTTYIRKIDANMVCLTVTSTGTDVEEILSCFSEY